MENKGTDPTPKGGGNVSSIMSARQPRQDQDQLDLCVRPTDAATHVGTSSRSEEPCHETAAVVVAVDLHLLAGLADRLEGLLLVEGTDVHIAVVQ